MLSPMGWIYVMWVAHAAPRPKNQKITEIVEKYFSKLSTMAALLNLDLLPASEVLLALSKTQGRLRGLW